MRTESKTTSSIVRIPCKIVVKGNENGATVTSNPTSASPGDGDINTGHGGYVFGSLIIGISKISAYGKSKNADCLVINTTKYIDLGNYDYAPDTWFYMNNQGEKVTVKERFTYSLCTHKTAYYHII